MLMRTWRGWTTKENAGIYESLLLGQIFPGIEARRIAGYRGVSLAKRQDRDEVLFLTILWFDSEDAIRAFAGEDSEAAFVPAAARAILLRFDDRATHFETVIPPPRAAAAVEAEAGDPGGD